ncbi:MULTISPECIES: DUF883 family protein [Cupriavidus]|uniref:DUF883 domain-containing protein n=2 Tax=Cupriavidus TaxID=106589 RepID=A0A375J622_9BURK|nr:MULTISPECIES: hypothetical protein [Cupriavidus]MBB3013053.1 ElaB/YqjD/DUF883 family membrane-anchored ribosome-binding protein [Cupriavidus alkaliphilus]RAS06941.1 ElaB/YqjD/DUF883 family membrane-anchored ribosome-binding protein [Cupriavidus alkaliphilus]SCB18288.1 Membrane-anchored ribosome-binding protein, inhibits growth in stationary phase, ElaB/YqjD/DUF883 family [Cupriavidus alkaliphilus]SPS00567.1 conserved hypothetical protein [Cupriavidus taiwanensis]
MEQTETTSTPTSTSGLRQQETRMSSASGSETRSGASWRDTPERSSASQDLARELDRLIDRLPTLSGDNLEQAKAEFVELAAKSGSAATEIAAKSADVARRVKGRVKSEWETGLERTETFVHANPVRALGMALGIGVVLGARLFGGSHRHHRDM